MEFIHYVYVGVFFAMKVDTVGLVHHSRMFMVHRLHAFVEFPEWGATFALHKARVGVGDGAIMHDVIYFRVVDVVSQVSADALFIAP